MDSEKEQYIRIMKGEMGPNASQREADRMAQTIYNRQNHREINGDLYSSSAYNTLSHSNHDYQLTAAQRAVFENAYNNRTSGNHGYLGWDTSNSSIKSNRYYEWTAGAKLDQHYYYTATKKK
jgi:hypothetical protein